MKVWDHSVVVEGSPSSIEKTVRTLMYSPPANANEQTTNAVPVTFTISDGSTEVSDVGFIIIEAVADAPYLTVPANIVMKKPRA